MARVNIEGNAFHQALSVSKYINKPETFVIGGLVLLWHSSQSLFKLDATADEICFWSHIFDKDLKTEWVKGLVLGGFLRAIPDSDRYHICGNHEHIENIVKRLERAHKGGAATKARWEHNKRQSEAIEGFVEAISPTQAPIKHSLQPGLTKASEGSLTLSLSKNKEEEKNKELNLSDGSPEPSTLNQQIWKAYSDAYQVRYKTPPVRNAMVNSLVAQLGKRLGQEAVEVVKFYLTHNHGFYVAKCHHLSFCIKDAESLRTQWVKNKTVTENDVKQVVKADAFKSQLERIQTGEL